MPQASLLVIKGTDQGTRFQLDEIPTSIGRTATANIRVLDSEVSRIHAKIEFIPDRGWKIVDQQSSNGTFINKKRIQGAMLHNGDQIELGSTILVFSQNSDSSNINQASQHVKMIPANDRSDRSQIISHFKAPAKNEDDSGSKIQSPLYSERVLKLIYEISEEAVKPTVSLNDLLQGILDKTLHVMRADRGCILLEDPETQEIVPTVYALRLGGQSDQQMTVSRSIVDYVLHQDQGVRTTDALHDSRFQAGQSILKAGIREALCVPVHSRFKMLGAIYLDCTLDSLSQLTGKDGTRFSDEDLRMLLAIGRQAALAIENNQFQDSLVKAERLAAVGQTIAFLSHHIKNILQGMRGGGYLINQGLQEEKPQLVKQGWNIVDRNQDRIFNMVTDMLTFSKERQPEPEPYLLNDIIEDIQELMVPRALENLVTIECRLDPNMQISIFDPEGIHRAILNVVTNAIDACSERDQGHVLISTHFKQQDQLLIVDVEDNGPGIETEQLKKIFNLFESTKGTRGTGIGLAVSRKILKEHDGEITVRSTVGTGTIFSLSWPFSPCDEDQLESATMEHHE